jgi:glycosyltransferase involved in cell wall biosynthesis
LIGRGNAKKKRFYIGIEAFDYIAKEFPNCELNIISNLTGIERLQNLVNNLNLEKNIQFNGYSSVPDIYFKNASLNIFPSISEAFPMVLSETKIYGIPSVIIGIDYILIAKGGTIIIYDDRPESLAAEAIKLMESKEYRKKLGKEARNSMKKFNNELLLGDWAKLILSIYKGENIKLEENNLSEDEGINILNNQLKLLKMRYEIFQNITRKEFENYTYLKNIQLY